MTSSQIATVVLPAFAYDFHCYACRNGLAHAVEQHQELITHEVDADMDCALCRAVQLHSASQHEAALEDFYMEEIMAVAIEQYAAPSDEEINDMAEDYYRNYPQVLDDEPADYLELCIEEMVYGY